MRRLFSAVVALAVPLAGCPGNLDDPGRFAAEFGDGGEAGACPDVPTLLAATCTAAGCHAASAPAVGLDLASPGLFTRLSGTKATGGAGLLIDPTSAVASVLYTKLLVPPPFGARMPLVGPPLGDADVACVLSWIETSAKGAP